MGRKRDGFFFPNVFAFFGFIAIERSCELTNGHNHKIVGLLDSHALLLDLIFCWATLWFRNYLGCPTSHSYFKCNP